MLTSSKSFLAILILFTSLLSGCASYVFRAAYEEGKILWRREPIETLLDNPDLDAKKKEKFQLVLQVREYAREKLKMTVKGSYASYSHIDRSVLSYVLMAAPKTSLTHYTWWFLLVGRVPYKGFFSEEEAKAEAKSFQAQGYDTYIRTSAAFSTLGWFNDPLLSNLLRYDRVTLAEVIFHELLHNTIYVKGAGDFNESLANFVGNRAAIDFFRERYGEGSPEHQRAIQNWQEEVEFSTFITGVARSLKNLYAKGLPEKDTLRLREEIFFRSQEEWARRIANRPEHRFRRYSRQGQEVNNAVIGHYLLYLRDLGLFQSLYEADGKNLVRVMDSVKGSVQTGGDPYQMVQQLLNGSKRAREGESG